MRRDPSERRSQPGSASGQGRANLVRVGVIGYGYWGPNIVRNLHGLENCEVVAICDKNPTALRRARAALPGCSSDDGLRGRAPVAGYRRRRRRHAGVDALRAGEGGARERQARLRREAVHVDARAGGGADRAGRAQEPEDHGGPHVPLQRRGARRSARSSTRARSGRSTTSIRRA